MITSSACFSPTRRSMLPAMPAEALESPMTRPKTEPRAKSRNQLPTKAAMSPM